MFSKILCPIDFSEYSEEITNYAVNIAKKYNSLLHMLHVIPNLNYFIPYGSFLAAENLVAVEKNIEMEVEKDFEKITRTIDMPVTKAIRTGVAFLEIVDYIDEQDIDLVVMGTHGRSGIEHILIGSVAEKIVRKSPCPVLTIRPKSETSHEPQL